MLQEVCLLAVEVGGYRMAWVGFVESGPEKRVRPVAWAGHEAGYLQTVDITWADEARGRCPMLVPRRPQPRRRRVQAPGTFPLRTGG